MYKSLLITLTIILFSGQSNGISYNGTCPAGCQCYYVDTSTGGGGDIDTTAELTSINVNEATLSDTYSNGGDNSSSQDPSMSVFVECARVKPRLESLPPRTQLPENIFALDVTLNDIETLDLIDSMDTLSWFKISGNELRSLSPETFHGVRNLRYLDLKDNNLTDLPDGVFDKLTSLEVLDVSTNKLRHLPIDSLKYNTKLRKLDLSHNPLRIIHPEWFTGLTNLVELSLVGNELLTILPDTFKWTPNLESIDLSENQFKYVPSFALKLARNLKKLKFNHNAIERIDQDSFEQLTNLEEIELNYNQHLIEIQLRSFYNLQQLRTIKIEHNPDLSHLDDKAFIGMSYNKTNSNLEQLSLAGNRFTTLPRYSLNWCELKSLDLRENPWTCDCNLEWTRDCPSVIGNPKCASPTKSRGIILYHVLKEDFGCESVVDVSKDGTGFILNGVQSDQEQTNHKESAIEQARNVKFMIMLFAVLVLFFLGLAIAVIVKSRDSRGMKMKRGSGSIYYMKTPNGTNNNQPSLI